MRTSKPYLRCAAALAGLTLTGGCASMVRTASVADLEKQAVGAWRLVKTEQKLADGTVRAKPAYGPNGTGYIIYDTSHMMCVFLANPDAPPPVPGQPRGEPGSSMENPASYCARWHVDPRGPWMVHKIEMIARSPEKGATALKVGDQIKRQFRREGDRLYLRPTEAAPGVVDYVLTFERVRNDG